jgi:hypothetical protein
MDEDYNEEGEQVFDEYDDYGEYTEKNKEDLVNSSESHLITS